MCWAWAWQLGTQPHPAQPQTTKHDPTGKTIQVIALFSLLREKGVHGPFLVVAPLATLPNWVNEVRKWLPSAGVLLYHGNPEEREALRLERMPLGKASASRDFPVVVTSYEMASIDRKHLMRYQWRWLVVRACPPLSLSMPLPVRHTGHQPHANHNQTTTPFPQVDEGQRIKNRNGKLFNELKEIPSESRLLLSGTPIQNSLEELWTLLNFCQPDIFDDIDVFRSWYGVRMQACMHACMPISSNRCRHSPTKARRTRLIHPSLPPSLPPCIHLSGSASRTSGRRRRWTPSSTRSTASGS